MPRQVTIDVPTWDVLTIVRQRQAGQTSYTIDVGFAVQVQGEAIAAHESITVRGADLPAAGRQALAVLDPLLLAQVRSARGL